MDRDNGPSSSRREYNRVLVQNGLEGWTYGFMLERDDMIVWEDSCGVAGVLGCRDSILKLGMVYRNKIILALYPLYRIVLDAQQMKAEVAVDGVEYEADQMPLIFYWTEESIRYIEVPKIIIINNGYELFFKLGATA